LGGAGVAAGAAAAGAGVADAAGVGAAEACLDAGAFLRGGDEAFALAGWALAASGLGVGSVSAWATFWACDFRRRHLGDDRGERPLLHLGGDRQAHAVVQQHHARRGVLGLHAFEHLDQAVDLGGLPAVGLGEQALDVGLQPVQRLDLGVELGFGGGHQGKLGGKVVLALVEFAAP
jgi:hypothetical protein